MYPLQEIHSNAASINANLATVPPRSRPPPRVASFGSLRGLYNAAAAQNSGSTGSGTRPRTRSAFDSSTDLADSFLSNSALLEEDELLEERTVQLSGSDDARCLSWSSLESAAAAPASTGTAAAHRHQQQQQQRYTTSSKGTVAATAGASHLALVVVVSRSSSSSETAANGNSSSNRSSSGGGTTVLLRSNVSILNDTPAPALIDTYRTGAESLQTLAPTACASLPLPLLARRSLRVRADGTHAWDAPIKLTPALLNPTTPSALRRTQALEANSLHLRCTPHDNSSADALSVATAAAGSGSDSAKLSSPVRDRSRSTAVKSFDVADVQYRGRSASASGPSSRTASPTQVNSIVYYSNFSCVSATSCSLVGARIAVQFIKLCLLFT
jgi:hypothetical protein